jgi:hypothetical protein
VSSFEEDRPYSVALSKKSLACSMQAIASSLLDSGHFFDRQIDNCPWIKRVKGWNNDCHVGNG